MYYIHRFFESYLVWPLPFSILMIILAGQIWKKQRFVFARQFFRLVLLINWIIGLILIFYAAEEIGINLNRAQGRYWWAYSTMLFFAIFLPPILLFPKIGKNRWVLFIVSILANLGTFIEVYVLMVTTLNQTFLPPSYYSGSLKTMLLKSFILALFLTGVELIFSKKGKSDNHFTENDEILDQPD